MKHTRRILFLILMGALLFTVCGNSAAAPAETEFRKGASYAPWLPQPVYSLNSGRLTVDTNNIYAVGDGTFSISYDGGNTTVVPPVKFDDAAAWTYGLYVSPDKTAVAYEKGSSTYITISGDSGKTWDTYPIGKDILMPNCAGYYIQFMDQNNGWLVAESVPLEQEPHGKRCPNRIFRTSDGGITWEETGNTGDAGFARTISGIGFSSKDTGFISFIPEYWIGPIVYGTRDGGKTWTPSEGLPGLPEQYDYSTPLSPVFDGPNGILPVRPSAGNGIIYYATKDYGLSWEYGKGFGERK